MAARRNGTGSAAVAVKPAVRCGIYTRKSTTEGLDSSFNTLDNQRRAAEAFVASQQHAGWTVEAERYDDGGFSGGNTERPALQRLLADAQNGVLDTIVVYRLDRLSRSLIDFLQIHNNLEKWGVGLVSVTEHINTTTPHGRMMVNVLLSFAQYERELIGERTRDKVTAARRLGRWTGGMPLLGFDTVPEGGKLVVNQNEAEQVRAIFDLYIEHQSLLAVSEELARRGWRRKSWTTKDGKTRVGRPWNVNHLQRLLRNPIVAGKQTLGNATYKGEHPAIIAKATFDRVQRMLDANRRGPRTSHRNRHGALLRGLLRCGRCGAAMTHAFTERGARAYRYYRCVRSIKSGAAACPGSSVPALKIEDIVVEQIKRIGADPALCAETFRQVQAQAQAEQRALKLESRRIDRDLVAARAELGQLTTALARATGSAADAVMARLAEAQERVVVLERRQREIGERQTRLAAQDVDPDAVGRALAQFTDVWEVLLTPERERVIQLLIERIEYNGANGEITLKFSPAGARLLTAETAQ